ncbi:MAG: glycosyltransferase family 39 protein [Candidatus Omnitrophica bacterium]|nr:glycosyltransferase family 39 protein [Candidatus Omnitrophota bacterium]
MNRNKIRIFTLVVLSFLVRFAILLNSDNFSGNFTMGKVVDALRILEDPRFSSNFDANTSMLYQYLLAATMHLWPDPLLSPRVLSLIFGVLLVIPFYFLVKTLFNENIAFYSGILLSLYPLHVIQSVITGSDVIFHFTFFSCLYYLFKFKQKDNKIIWLILSAVLFNIASMLRFESWALIPLLSIFLYKDGKKYMMAFLFLSLISIFIWLYLCHHYTQNTFYSFIISGISAHSEILLRRGPHSEQIFGWLYILFKGLGNVVVISGLCGIIYSFFKKSSLYLAVLFFAIYCFYTINTLLSRMWFNERYVIILGLFILPYTVLIIEKISNSLKVKPIILFSVFIFLSIVEFKKITLSHIPRLPQGIKDVAGWLKSNKSPSDEVIMGTDAWDLSDQDIIVRSGVYPWNFFVVSTPLCGEQCTPGTVATSESIGSYFSSKQPRFLILNSTGFLQKILNFNMGQKTISEFGYIFESVYSIDTPNLGRFNVYIIHYKNNQ